MNAASNSEQVERPLLIVISAPAGAGKSTLCNKLIDLYPGMSYSVSCTTRQPRGAEVDGVNYYFLSADTFKERIANGDFLEYAEVHGHFYGTLKSTVSDTLQSGGDVIMDIDVQGAKQIRALCQSEDCDPVLRKAFLDVFISPPSMDVLEQRLRGRDEDSEETIQKRLRNAEGELACMPLYKYHIVNDDLETAFKSLQDIYTSEKSESTEA